MLVKKPDIIWVQIYQLKLLNSLIHKKYFIFFQKITILQELRYKNIKIGLKLGKKVQQVILLLCLVYS